MAVTETPVAGRECKLFYNNLGVNTHAAPSWNEVTRAIDVNYDLDIDEADQSSRSSGFKKGRAAMIGLEFSWSYRKKQGTDTVFDFLQAAALARTSVELWVADGTSTDTGVQGPRAVCQLFALGGAQALSSAEEVEFTARPTYFEESNTEVDPDWYEIT